MNNNAVSAIRDIKAKECDGSFFDTLTLTAALKVTVFGRRTSG